MINLFHDNGVTMSAMVSLITGVSIVCSTLRAVADQRKYQSSASLAFERGIHKKPATRKIFPFDDVTMYLQNVVICPSSKLFESSWQPIMTSWHWNIFHINSFLEREYTVVDFPHEWSVTRSFDVFCDVPRNKHLKKQCRCRLFETPWRSWDVSGIICTSLIYLDMYSI